MDSPISVLKQKNAVFEYVDMAGKVVDLQDMLAKTCLHHTRKLETCQPSALNLKLRPIHKTQAKQEPGEWRLAARHGVLKRRRRCTCLNLLDDADEK